MAAFLLRVALSWILLVLALPMGAAQHDSIITPPNDVSENLGGTAEFQCEVEFSEITVLAWEFNNQIIYSLQYGREDYPRGNVKYFVAQEERTFTLRINDLRYEDSGIYTCRVLDEAAEATLNVTETIRHRSIITPPSDVTGKLGGMAKFKCEVEFRSIPVMSWEFNLKIVYSLSFEHEDYPLGTARYSVTKEGGTFILTVRDIRHSDAGKYTCRVLNEAVEANLNVIEAKEPTILTPPSNATGKLGGIAEFSCKVEFASIKVMQWEFNQEAIYTMEFDHEGFPKGRSKYFVDNDGRTFTLIVKDLQYGDSGLYTCQVLKQAETANLIVAGTPKLSISTSIPVEGSKAKYTCIAPFTGLRKENIAPDHYPQLLMFFDGKPLNGTVIEEHVEGATVYYKLSQTNYFTLEAKMHGKILLCRVTTTSPAMQLSSTTEVTVLYSVRNVYYTPNRPSYKTGMVVKCTADGSPQPYFWWNRTNTGNLMPEIHGNSLEITERMVGPNTWTCTAINIISGHMYKKSVVANFSVAPDVEAVLHDATESETEWAANQCICSTL